MLILLAALSLTAAQTQPDPAVETGRDIFDAAICAMIGWEGDRIQAGVVLTALGAAHPDRTEEQIAAAATTGGDLARAEFETRLMAAKSDRASLTVWADAMTRRCDALAARYPLMLRRGPETDQRWADQRAVLEQQIAN